ncbi:hypothetical protein VB636_02750, partial [Paracoccus sp. APAP_BH8]|uniref:hypothetical protein n=1 Tax=Paracoccus sp. APAP_BH8 TaxID=3110237 RepID=UPI002FD80941
MIPAVCRGEKVVAIGMSEPDAGSALTDQKTRARLPAANRVICTLNDPDRVLGLHRRRHRRLGPCLEAGSGFLQRRSSRPAWACPPWTAG